MLFLIKLRMIAVTIRLTFAGFSVVAASFFAAAPVFAQTAQTATATPQTTPIPLITRGAAWWTDAGRILAGDVPSAGSVLGKIANQPSVQQHRGAFARSWSQFEAARLKPAMKFAQDEITTQPQAEGPVY